MSAADQQQMNNGLYIAEIIYQSISTRYTENPSSSGILIGHISRLYVFSTNESVYNSVD